MSILQRVLFASAFILSAFSASSQTYVFAELQGQPLMNTTGWQVSGNSAVGDTPGDVDNNNNELILTQSVGGQTGRAFFEQALNLGQCTKWRAEFEFRIFDGTSADGIVFCFLDAIPTGLITGGELGLPAGINGLKVAFDTYNNAGTGNTGCGANPEVQIAFGPGYVECPIPSTPATYSISRTNGVNIIRSNTYNSAVVNYNAGNITVSINGTQYLTAFHVINFPGYVGFAAGTGDSYDRQSVRNVTIYADLAVSNAGPNVSYCTGSSTQIGAPSNPDYTYSWSPAIGLSATNIANPTVSQGNAGTTPINLTYTVTTSVTGSSTNCTTQDQVVVTINPIATSNFTLSKTNICPNEPITITYTGNLGPLAGYNWDFDGGTVISGTGQGPYQVSWANSASAQVSLSVSQFGCSSDTTVKNLTIQPAPVLNISGPSTICLGDTAIYTGTTDITNSVIGWTPGPLTGSPVNLLPNVTTTYTVQAVSPAGCLSNDSTFTLTVNPDPVATIVGDTLVCKGDSTLLVGSSSLASSNLVWLAPIGSGNPQVWVMPSVDQKYGLVAVKDGCISDTAYFTVQVDSVPNLTAPDSITVCVGETVNVDVSSTTPETSFDWQPGGLTGTQQTISPVNDIQYEVYAYNSTCTSETKIIEITVLQNCDCKLVMPNIFTPNGDQVNDSFTALNPQNCEITTFDLVLYNRWGAEVWKSSNINAPWGGKCMMGDCSDGTYYWVLNYSYTPGGASGAKSVTEKGIVTIAH